MSGDDVPSLPRDVAELAASARRIEGPTREVRSRLRARLVSPLPPPPASPAPSARAPWWAVAAALVVGVGAGRLIAPSSTGPAPATRSTDARGQAPPIAPSSSNDRGASTPASPEAAPPSTAASAASAAATAAAGSKASGDLAAERRLLERARAALGRGNGDDALAACDDHGRSFPRGQLSEEREAIAVQALMQVHRSADARARGERFRHAYPKSILLPAVLAALETEP